MNSRIVAVSVVIGSELKLDEELEPSATTFGSDEMKLTEAQIEQFLAENLNLVLGDNDLRVVGRQVVNEQGGSCDLVVLDTEGDLTVVEIKRDAKDASSREESFEVQAIRYAANFAKLEKVSDLINQVYRPYLARYKKDSNIDPALDLVSLLGGSFPDDHFNRRQKIMLVASGFDANVLSGCAWLRKNGIDVSCVQITPVQYGDKFLLVVEKIIPPPNMDDYLVSVTDPSGKKTVRISDRTRTRLSTTSDMLNDRLFKVGDTVFIKGQPDNAAVVVDAKFVEKDGRKITWNEWVKTAKKLDAVSIYHHVTLEAGGQTLHDLRMA